jgi:hypothetical protein
MATYLYCVLAPPRTEALPRGLVGVGGAPVRTLVLGSGSDVEAWVATIDDAALRVSGRALAEQALLHNDVVDAALATGRTPAPARFGSYFADDAECMTDLARRSGELATTLDRIANAVEMSVLLVPSAHVEQGVRRPGREEPAAGRRYLEIVRERTHREETRRAAGAAEANRITEAVRGIARDESRSSGSGALSIAHLVPIRDVERYRRAVAALVPAGEFRLVIGKPRAPYSFVTQNPGVGGHDSGSLIRDE